MIDASGLVRELVAHLSRDGLSVEERQRAEAVVWDVIEPLPVATLSPPLPVDDRARRIADGLLADPTDGRTLAAWGRAVGTSERTLARVLSAETGMGFERWRSTARLAAALPLLASGMPVGTTAHCVGYGTPSAFVAAGPGPWDGSPGHRGASRTSSPAPACSSRVSGPFRRQVGYTPADYFRRT